MTKITEPGLFNDPKALNAIKKNANKAEGLQQVSDQFETMFLQMVLKSMRSASDALSSEESLVSTRQSRMYRDMHDGQLSMAMAKSGSIGIADAMVRQLSPLVGATQLGGTEHSDFIAAENKNASSLKSEDNMVADKLHHHDAFRQSLITLSEIQ